MIKACPFEIAPKEYRELSQNEGDEDWVVLVPKELTYCFIRWIDFIDSCRHPQKFVMSNGDNLYIGGH